MNMTNPKHVPQKQMRDMPSARIFVHGDPQIAHSTQESRNKEKVDIIAKHAEPGDITLVCGDCTQNGVGNVHSPIYLYGKICHCFRSSDTPSRNELKVFINDCMNPLEKACGEGNVLACPGNHDSHREYWFSSMNAVYDYLVKKYGRGAHNTYKKELDHIIIFSLGVYPNAKRLDWFKTQLKQTTKPFVVFWHYNLQGSYSDFWSDKEKENVYDVLNSHRDRCLFICEGHIHATYIREWKGFRVANGAGNAPVEIIIEKRDDDYHVDARIIRE